MEHNSMESSGYKPYNNTRITYYKESFQKHYTHILICDYMETKFSLRTASLSQSLYPSPFSHFFSRNRLDDQPSPSSLATWCSSTYVRTVQCFAMLVWPSLAALRAVHSRPPTLLYSPSSTLLSLSLSSDAGKGGLINLSP